MLRPRRRRRDAFAKAGSTQRTAGCSPRSGRKPGGTRPRRPTSPRPAPIGGSRLSACLARRPAHPRDASHALLAVARMDERERVLLNHTQEE